MVYQSADHSHDKSEELRRAVQQARELALEGKILLDETPPDINKVKQLAHRSERAVETLGQASETLGSSMVSGWEKVASIPLANQAAQHLWLSISQLQHEAGKRPDGKPQQHAANDDEESPERWQLGRKNAKGFDWAEFSPGDGSLPTPGTTPLHALPQRNMARYA